jgi:hypothetical protein
MNKGERTDDIIVLEWNFSPSDYFEEPVQIDGSNYLMTIEKGKVQARIDPAVYGKDHKMRDELHDSLNYRFLGVQLLTHERYELSKASMYRLHSDGCKDITIFPESCSSATSVGPVNLILKDKNGRIQSDSRQERVQRKKHLSELAEKYAAQDPLVSSLLDSYKAAVNDPDNELVHLFEILEGLKIKFGGDDSARKTLGISKAQWSRLGQLANDPTLRQGRHRGGKVGALRDATEAELKEARNIARLLIESYLGHLEERSGR